jgi:hypothetical protein
MHDVRAVLYRIHHFQRRSSIEQQPPAIPRLATPHAVKNGAIEADPVLHDLRYPRFTTPSIGVLAKQLLGHVEAPAARGMTISGGVSITPTASAPATVLLLALLAAAQAVGLMCWRLEHATFFSVGLGANFTAGSGGKPGQDKHCKQGVAGSVRHAAFHP